MAVNFKDHPLFRMGGSPFRAEVDLYDCEVEGRLPDDLNGTFYRVGPDFHYPPRYANEVPFNGDGHLAMFRFYGGNVDFRSRFVQTQRFLAERAARQALFGNYRNRYTDLPGVRRLSGGTANTHVMYHHGKLMALKEDSPPVVLDPHSLATLDNYYTFKGTLESLTFTAHPKLDAATGEMIAFGYEARGEASRDVCVFSVDAKGAITWQAWFEAPYTCMLHDFAVTANYVAFLVIPYVTSVERMKAGEVHWAWDSTLPSWFGVLRRGGDGKDVRWFKGPERCATHTMGSWNEGTRIFCDMDMGRSAQFPFFPILHGGFEPQAAAGRITRLSVDLATRQQTYDEQILYPDWVGALPRQDDRYNGVPYRFGIMPCGGYGSGPPTIVTFDHARRTTASWRLPDDCTLQEPIFVPRSRSAAEGDGYVIAMIGHTREAGRNDLVILDTHDLAAGPIAAVKLPFKAMAQVHGWWVPEWELAPVPLG